MTASINHEGKKLDRLCVAVIGAGKMGFLHSGIFNSFRDCRLVAICEKNSTIVGILEQNLPKIRIFKDYHEMLENGGIDIVVVTTPVYLHRTMIESALSYGVNVFAEKPLALSGIECRSLVERVHSSKTMVGYCRRFMGTYKFVKNIIESEKLGCPIRFRSQLFVGQIFKKSKGWQYDISKSGGGVVMDLGSHAIDMFHFLFGSIRNVTAIGHHLYDRNIEDHASIALEFENYLKGSLEVSWSMKDYRMPELKIIVDFDHGSIIATEKYVDIFSNVDEGSIKKGHNIYYKQQLAEKVSINIGGQEYTSEDRYFVQCVLDNKEPTCSFKEGAKTNAVIDSIYKSMKEKHVEKINYLSE